MIDELKADVKFIYILGDVAFPQTVSVQVLDTGIYQVGTEQVQSGYITRTDNSIWNIQRTYTAPDLEKIVIQA